MIPINDIYYSQTAGFYRPTMFHIQICNDVDLKDMASWDDVCMSAFFHEYIHFLQDIMTSFGLYNIFVNGEYIAHACNYIYGQPKGDIKVPIPINPGPTYIYENKEVSKLTKVWDRLLPNRQDNPMHILSKPKPNPRTVQLWDKALNIDEYKVACKEGNFTVGGFHILESMAYLAQKSVYDKKMPYLSPDYPYNVVEQIANQYNIPISDKRQYHIFLFGLCHISMMTSHPIKTLTALLDAAERKAVNNGSWKSFVEYNYRNTYVQNLNGKVKNIAEGLNDIKDLALQNLDKQFGTPDHQQLYDWYHNAIEEMCRWWQSNPMILIDMLEFGDPKNNTIFKTFIERIGTPLLTNAGNMAYICEPKGIHIPAKRHARFLAAGSIVSTLLDGDFHCQLKDICIANTCCTGKRCDTAPWMRARLISPCPYGHLWYGWKLRHWIPVH